MHNWLIFQYHHVRAQPKRKRKRGWLRPNLSPGLAGSKGVTQEGKRSRVMVVAGQGRRRALPGKVRRGVKLKPDGVRGYTC